jgi:hypothetical protein
MEKFNNYLFRCSELGNLITEPRTKADREAGELSQTTKSFLKSVYIREIYKREKEVDTKGMQKGKECEDDSITLLQNTKFKGQLLIKNKERKSNEFITGECDLDMSDRIIDIKTSENIFTFGNAEPTKMNETQVRGYQWLYGKKTGQLAYCLVDSPEHQISDELYRQAFRHSPDDYDDNRKYHIAKNMIVTKKHMEIMKNAHFPDAVESLDFVEVPATKRVKLFDVEFDSEFEIAIMAKVIRAREFLNKMAL